MTYGTRIDLRCSLFICKRWVFTFFILQVLAPEVNKLLNLMYFQRKAVDSFCSEVHMTSKDHKKYIKVHTFTTMSTGEKALPRREEKRLRI